MCVPAATFELGSLSVLGQGNCVERLSLLNVEAVEIFILMRDKFILLFPKRPQVRTMYACVQT